jgi:hypothetical protein
VAYILEKYAGGENSELTQFFLASVLQNGFYYKGGTSENIYTRARASSFHLFSHLILGSCLNPLA